MSIIKCCSFALVLEDRDRDEGTLTDCKARSRREMTAAGMTFGTGVRLMDGVWTGDTDCTVNSE